MYQAKGLTRKRPYQDRDELAKQLQLDADASITYYIDRSFRHSSFLDEIMAAVRIVTENTCVEMNATHHERDADLVFARSRSFHGRIPQNDVCNSSGFHQGREYVYFSTHHADRWSVLRSILLCLAPFRYEFQRSDRNEHMIIHWTNILSGMEHVFLAKRDYPPNIPGFPKYSHGNVVNRGFYYYSKNGHLTMFPKYHEDLELYEYVDWEVDIMRLRLFYGQLKFRVSHRSPRTRKIYFTWETKEGCEANWTQYSSKNMPTHVQH